jgi:hypothetical protein
MNQLLHVFYFINIIHYALYINLFDYSNTYINLLYYPDIHILCTLFTRLPFYMYYIYKLTLLLYVSSCLSTFYINLLYYYIHLLMIILSLSSSLLS